METLSHGRWYVGAQWRTVSIICGARVVNSLRRAGLGDKSSSSCGAVLRPSFLWSIFLPLTPWWENPCEAEIVCDSQQNTDIRKVCVPAELLQSCLILCDCSPPGSSVHGILQARILEWVPCPPPGDGASWSRDPTHYLLSLLNWQVGSLPLMPPGKPDIMKKSEMKVKVAWSCRTLCDPDQNSGVGSCSLLQGIFPTQVSHIARGFFTSWVAREA